MERATGIALGAGRAEEMPRQLEYHWNGGMIAAAIAISFLGAFTSTQLMCQARMSVHISSVLVWTILGSLTFGFCSIWCLHFVAMLACELDLPIGINVPLTFLSAVLAVIFTFAALASDLLWDTYMRGRRRNYRPSSKRRVANGSARGYSADAADPITSTFERQHEVEVDEDGQSEDEDQAPLLGTSRHAWSQQQLDGALSSPGPTQQMTHNSSPTLSDTPVMLNGSATPGPYKPTVPSPAQDSTEIGEEPIHRPSLYPRRPSEHSISRRSDSLLSFTTGSFGLGSIMNIAHRSTSPAKNAFKATGEALHAGCTIRNIAKGFLWSIAITSMHYSGIAALRIPGGYFTLHPFLVILSGLISWLVCLVGCVLMSQIETHFTQQFLFAAVACTGVAAMHFTGMRAVTFWSEAPSSTKRGYPSAIPVAVASIAIVTCIAANFLLAHVATLSRNKLAEIVLTRKQLWRTIAQKENAEAAAAAKSDFIASASHEIRTPLHHLQGYSDLLSQTKLTEEGRTLLSAIQHATKTLSLITNNVLDWSKLEKDVDAVCRPVALDMRNICESTILLLPNKDDEAEVDLMVVVSPSVPHSLFLDETYIQRVLMNLLSNALKFTSAGYILLVIEMDQGTLTATIEDTGSGIPASFLPQLFEPFKQATTRGSQRGTGLGMSIIKQLLYKMDGTIAVESRHLESTSTAPGQSGTTFTINIPVPAIGSPVRKRFLIRDPNTIAVFHGGNERSFHGLRTAWEKYEYDVVRIKAFSDLSGSVWKYIWMDLEFAEQNPSILFQLLQQEQWLVLVPYNTPESLQRFPRILSASKFIPIQKPLVWHTFQQRIAEVSEQPNSNPLARSVRFAPEVEIVDGNDHGHAKEPILQMARNDQTILLVEDNPINQKLGKKMLVALKYEVLLANDGQQAIEQLKQYDATIDAVLMDQSMPVKDGVTATQEIREMEAAGTLSRRRPIIAVTAVVSAQAQSMFKDAGADDFLTKPLSLGKLGQTLAAHLSQDPG